MKRLFLGLALSLSILTSGCTNASFFAANLPTHFDDVRIAHDIAYGPDADQTLDIYRLPERGKKTPLPVIIFFYGGRWETGGKEDYRFVGSALAKAGFLVVIPDYRKYPAVKFPAFIDDAARAIAWTADHVGAHGGDPADLNVAGHSAGAHIAALAITDPHYLKAFGKTRATVKKFVGMAGPYAFVPDEEDLKAMFGPPANYPKMQVTTFIDGKQSPMLLMWGDKDTSVGQANLNKLVATIHKKGGCVETKIYPGIDHAWLIGTLSWVGDARDTVLADMTGFFKRTECRSGF